MKETPISKIQEIKIHGRTTDNREPLTLFWTASGFECNVSGSELWVEVEVTYDTYEPWFSYMINDNWIGRQMLTKGRYWICLFRGMSSEKIKNVKFIKDLQAMSDDANSLIHIHALRYDGVFYPVVEKLLKIEFIGDSITSGEGLFGAKREEDWIPMFFSALRDYAYLTAKALDAEYRVFSQSGWGITGSWDNNPNCAIPNYYREICSVMKGEQIEKMGGHKTHDFSKWQPDVVVVNLGTNDASAFEQPGWTDETTKICYKMRKNNDGSYNEDDINTLKDSIIKFLYVIRECNPNAYARQGRVYGHQNADIACNHIHTYKDDFALMRLLGVKAYRFSVSWARILPQGTGKVNEKAIELYRNMIIEMKENNIVPYLTMFHWEYPQALQEKGGWLNSESVEWFAQYAKVIADNFSDIVEYFFTLNEPQCFVGYKVICRL